MLSAHHNGELHAPERRDAASENAPVVIGSLSGIKVLAVDDDTDSRGAIERILERCGATVRTASSMEEALSEFTQFSPHVILSDIGMPVHDGFELISRLRALPGARHIPAVALTALARSEDRTRVLRAGFQMHLAKPVESHELVAVVQNLAALRVQQT
jgi:CheY-like chemotaxis protein